MTPTEIARALGYYVVREEGAPNEFWCDIVVKDLGDQNAFCELCQEQGHEVVPVTRIRPWVHQVSWVEINHD